MKNGTQDRIKWTGQVPPGHRRAKIVCTIGPASDTEEMIRELMLRGMAVARLNFSHGSHQDHARVIRGLLKAAGTTSTAGATNFMRLITAGQGQSRSQKKNASEAKGRKRHG